MPKELATLQIPSQKIESFNVTKLDYFITTLVVCISGNPIITNGSKWHGIIAAFIMLLICLVLRRSLINISFLKWLIGFALLFTLQRILLPTTSIPAEVNFIAKLYTIFLATLFLGAKFRYTYFNLIYIISAISLICLTLNYLGINMGVQFEKYRTIFVYNSFIHFEKANIHRNCGMFWEPGAFQGYIMLAFLFYINDYKSLWKTHKRKCVILSLALLTTFSTTGYIVYILYITYIIFTNHINYYIKTLVILIMLICNIYAYNNIDFLGEKIEEQYENAQNLRTGDVSWTRMGALMIDIQHIKKHPMIGNGFVMTSRYGVLGNKMHGSGNGFTGAINMFGIPCILIYLILVYRNLNFTNLQKIFFVSIIIILLNGEFFLNYPLFWGLIFINIPQNTFALKRNQ